MIPSHSPAKPRYDGDPKLMVRGSSGQYAAMNEKPGTTMRGDDGHTYVACGARWSLRRGPAFLPLAATVGAGPQTIMASAEAPPSLSAIRKASPVFSGVLNYFPDALMAVARVSKAGNDKHNPGQPLHWSREKSNDHLDCAARHMLTPYEIDPDSKEVHLANAVWRLLAELQIHEEKKQ